MPSPPTLAGPRNLDSSSPTSRFIVLPELIVRHGQTRSLVARTVLVPAFSSALVRTRCQIIRTIQYQGVLRVLESFPATAAVAQYLYLECSTKFNAIFSKFQNFLKPKSDRAPNMHNTVEFHHEEARNNVGVRGRSKDLLGPSKVVCTKPLHLHITRTSQCGCGRWRHYRYFGALKSCQVVPILVGSVVVADM